jgi:hypothetical protein
MCQRCIDEVNEAIPGLTSVQMLGPGDDALIFALKAIEAHINETGWDQPPQYFALGRNDGGLGASTLVLPDNLYENTAAMLQPFVSWLDKGALGGVSTREERFHHLRGCLPENFYGLILFDEGWVLHTGPDTPANKREEYERASREHTIADHPDCVEGRYGIAVTVDGRVVTISRDRGHEPQITDSLGPDFSINSTRGTIPDALRLLCNLCQDAVS